MAICLTKNTTHNLELSCSEVIEGVRSTCVPYWNCLDEIYMILKGRVSGRKYIDVHEVRVNEYTSMCKIFYTATPVPVSVLHNVRL